MRFTPFFAALSAGILLSSFSARANPNTDCNSFLKRTDFVCNKLFETYKDRELVCSGTRSVAAQLCEAGEVSSSCTDQAVSAGAAAWITCLQYLKPDPTATDAQKMAVCEKAGQVFALAMAQTYCEKAKPEKKPETKKPDVSYRLDI